MATQNSNTLNDTKFADGNITKATREMNGTLPNPGPEYDQILSVFRKIMLDDRTAKNFTESLYRVSAETGTPVITLLDSLDTTTEMTLNATMAYYLNAINSPATLYGVQNPIVPNYYAGRNVLS